MKLSTPYIRIVYENLHSTVFVPLKINLPCEWLIHFKITNDQLCYGWTNPEGSTDAGWQEYVIEISKAKNTTYKDLVETLLHEMCHIALCEKGVKDWDCHGPNTKFNAIKNKVEAFTGLTIS